MASKRRGLGRLPRRPTVSVELSARDRLLLSALRKARVLRTPDLVPLIFPSLTVATRRLRRLHHGGYVALHCEDLHEPSRILLDRRGYELLATGPGDKTAERVAPPLPPQVGEHGFLTRRFWSLLAHSCHQSDALTLTRFLFEEEYGSTPQDLAQARYRPDAVFQLGAGDQSLGFALEIDRGTETPSYVATKKIAVFATARAGCLAIGGVKLQALAIAVPTARRAAAISAATPPDLRHLPVIVRPFTLTPDDLDLTTGWTRLTDDPVPMVLMDLFP